MKHNLIFLCLFTVSLVSIQAQNDKLRIAIFDPTYSGTAINEGAGMAVREIISTVFVNTGKYTIVERSLLEKVMNEQSFTNSGAVDDSQASEIGRLAGANKIVLSVVTQVENSYMLSIKLVDVNTASVERQKTQVIAVNRLLEFVEPLTMDLMGEEAVYPTVTVQPGGQNINIVQQQPAVQNAGIVGNHPAEPEMVFVQGGTFAMGGNRAHQVTISDFYIGKYEVTQGQWDAVMGATERQESDNYPISFVSYDDVQEFIRRLNALTGKNYRLPTEAEWEFAAQGGNQSKGYKFSGSNNVSDVAWYSGNSKGTKHPVGTKSPNELGIFDMSGNVWEWCNDWYGKLSKNAQTDPQGPSTGGTRRVVRGGAFTEVAKFARVSQRSWIWNFRTRSIGFRLACSSN